MTIDLRAPKVRPFVAEMPLPHPDESLLGYIDRALQRTLVRKLRQAMQLADVKLLATNASKLNSEAIDGVAKLFKLDPEEVRTRCYHREHPYSATMQFFGTELRSQYWEPTIRRVSPLSLKLSPYHRAIWELRPFAFDLETREELLDTCPVCESRLGWSAVRGAVNCDKCVDSRGLPKTDLRDYVQPLVQITDEAAVQFVFDLVHPDPDRRERAIRHVPAELQSSSNGQIFEAVMYVASCLRPSSARMITVASRPLSS